MSIPDDPLFGNQWHLRNTGQVNGTPGIDVNVNGVWDDYDGSGIHIGVYAHGRGVIEGCGCPLTFFASFADAAANGRGGLGTIVIHSVGDDRHRSWGTGRGAL